MSHCVEKLPHDCGSSDGLQVFEENGKYTGFCFACNTYLPDPYNDKPEGYKPDIKIKSPEEIQQEINDISSLPSHTIKKRRLHSASLDYFGIKVGVSESDGETPNSLYIPMYSGKELKGYKVNLLEPKKIWSIGDIKQADPPGWKQAVNSGSQKLYITEGEKDMVSVWQTIMKKQRGTQFEGNIPAVISLPSGSSSVNKLMVEKGKEIQDNFKEVVIVFDTDEAGKAATNEIVMKLPGAKVVTVPGKDANDCLMEGREKALASALLFKADVIKNSSIIGIDDIWDQIIQPVQLGLEFPFTKLNDMTRGLRYGETYYIGAGVKMGKSDIANYFASWFAIQHGVNVFMAKPEDSLPKLGKKMCGKAVGKVFHDPNRPYEMEDLIEGKRLLGDRIKYLDKYQHVGWDSLKKDIYNAAQALDCKIMFIDPITNLTNGVDPSAADTLLKGVAQDLAAMALDLDIAIFIFCHLKSPDAGPAHERGGKIFSNQFAGSRGMMRSCNYMLGLEGNKDPELPLEERNLRHLVILEDREFGESGSVPLYWDWNTELFNEIKG